jgi:hypothetical protein
MVFFGHSVTPGELLLFAWICSALAHCLPAPTSASSTPYVVLFNFVQLVMSNLSRMSRGTEPYRPMKVVAINRPCPPSSNLPPAA